MKMIMHREVDENKDIKNMDKVTDVMMVLIEEEDADEESKVIKNNGKQVAEDLFPREDGLETTDPQNCEADVEQMNGHNECNICKVHFKLKTI